jgi:putative RNA 2'-phosphotransferase
MSASTLVRRSKFLSLVLRHQPQTVGIALDAAGWVDVEILLAALARHGQPMTRAELDEVVATSDKQRFALSPDGARIRANQGHSVEVELGYEPAEPPELLYHGTVAEALPGIRVDGLVPMSRHAVHLSADVETASRVGGRRGAPVVLEIRAGEMHRAGHAFSRSANGVWLVDRVPPAFITEPRPRMPSRSERVRIAESTVAACRAGGYADASGARVELRAAIERAAASTRVVDPRAVGALAIARGAPTRIDVTGETTVAAILRLAGAPGLTVLNFASAKNPGGGFLGGAIAQEETLACASALYPCLLAAMSDHYEPNRANRSSLYLDLAILSEDVPFFRDDTGAWLAAPVLAHVITCAAPNASALRQNERSVDLERLPDVLRARARLVLGGAVALGARTLVLGAWGAGVFGNDPELVADAFAAPLAGEYAGAFDHVVFAVYDTKPGQPVLAAFRARFADLTPAA